MHPNPRMLTVATSSPGKSYKQTEIFELLGIKNEKISKIFNNSHIETRNLCFPTESYENGKVIEETNHQLWNKHRRNAIKSGVEAIEHALQSTGLDPGSIDYLVCVTSTGFLCPGLSAHLIKELNFRNDIHRADIVGMGCNAGLNGMQPIVNYCKQYPDKYGLLVCTEICSAAYVNEDNIGTAIVNSLFGDGAAAAIFGQERPGKTTLSPEIWGFKSHIITEHIDAMRFEFKNDRQVFNLNRQIPYVLGNNIEKPVLSLLKQFNLKVKDIDHWVVHSGGKKVIDSIKYNLDISDYSLRHTKNILKKFGNLSSGAFLFSHKHLIDEEIVKEGDYIFMITMGPGTTIECAIGKF